MSQSHESEEDAADQSSPAGAGVEVYQNNLLVLAGQHFSVGERNGQVGADQG